MPSYQKQITEKAKFTYSLLGNAFEKQTKAIENKKKKNDVKSVKSWWSSDKQLPSVKEKRKAKSWNYLYDRNNWNKEIKAN